MTPALAANHTFLRDFGMLRWRGFRHKGHVHSLFPCHGARQGLAKGHQSTTARTDRTGRLDDFFDPRSAAGKSPIVRFEASLRVPLSPALTAQKGGVSIEPSADAVFPSFLDAQRSAGSQNPARALLVCLGRFGIDSERHRT